MTVTKFSHIVNLDIYHRSILFSFGYKIEELKGYIEKKFECNLDELYLDKFRNASGLAIDQVCYPDVIIWMPKIPVSNFEYSSLQHEISHAVISILESLEIEINVKNSEAFCYLQGYITREIYRKLSSI
jgi:hypothetical protein